MKTTEHELDEYMKGRTVEDHVKMQDVEAAIRWLCGRLDEMKQANARLERMIDERTVEPT